MSNQTNQRPSYGALRKGAQVLLANAGVDNPAFEARILLGFASNKSPAELIISDAESVSEAIEMRFHDALGRRCAHEPMAYILGQKEFWSLPFNVDDSVLIPRPETELVVETGLKLLQSQPAANILDIGTGSGAILLALLHELDDATGEGVDISPAALDVAKANARRLGVQGRSRFYRSDFLQDVKGRYDLIVANPPYISAPDMAHLPPDVDLYEPELALYGGADGLAAYRRIIDKMPDVVKPGGHVVFEIGPDQKRPLFDLLTPHFDTLECRQDLAGRDRVVTGRKKKQNK